MAGFASELSHSKGRNASVPGSNQPRDAGHRMAAQETARSPGLTVLPLRAASTSQLLDPARPRPQQANPSPSPNDSPCLRCRRHHPSEPFLSGCFLKPKGKAGTLLWHFIYLFIKMYICIWKLAVKLYKLIDVKL